MPTDPLKTRLTAAIGIGLGQPGRLGRLNAPKPDFRPLGRNLQPARLPGRFPASFLRRRLARLVQLAPHASRERARDREQVDQLLGLDGALPPDPGREGATGQQAGLQRRLLKSSKLVALASAACTGSISSPMPSCHSASMSAASVQLVDLLRASCARSVAWPAASRAGACRLGRALVWRQLHLGLRDHQDVLVVFGRPPGSSACRAPSCA
jgi:hypothetical protein